MIRKHRCRTELPYNDLRARFLVDEKWGYLFLAALSALTVACITAKHVMRVLTEGLTGDRIASFQQRVLILLELWRAKN